MAALKYWVWLTTLPGLTNRSKLLLLEHFPSPEDIYYAQPEDLLPDGPDHQPQLVGADVGLGLF